MILGILAAIVLVWLALRLISSSARNAAEGVNGLTALVNRFNAWLAEKQRTQRMTQAERQAWFDAQIAAKKAEKREP